MDSENTIFLGTGKKKISFAINGEKYTLDANATELLLPEDINEKFNYRNFVSNQIYKLLDDKKTLTIEQLCKQSNSFFKSLLSVFIEENEKLKSIYDDTEIEEECERYIIAYNKYCVSNMSNGLQRVYDTINSTALMTTSSLVNGLMSFNAEFTQKLNKVIGVYSSWYDNYFEDIQKTINNVSDKLLEISQTILSGLYDVVKSIDIPRVSDEKKRELLKSYENWGKYGWTVLPYASIKFFNTCPETQIEADKLALLHCKREDMDNLFAELLPMCARKKDLREAIDCYYNKNYKACALLLFSIIDSRIIRMQNRNEKMGVGVAAIRKLKDKVKKDATEEHVLFLTLSYVNLFPCLFAVFEDTNNFKKKTKVINRNYLDHGMTSKVVRKKDCIKLFLLLYNLLEFIDIMK